MLFNSLEYASFFAIVLLLYFKLPLRSRWPILLLASYVFYMGWRPEFVLLLIFSTLVDFIGGLFIGQTDLPPRARKAALIATVSINLSLLVVLKYYNFFIFNTNTLLEAGGYRTILSTIHVVLPVGISFYTFQSLSYAFDVYKGLVPRQRHLGRYALYVAFFPQLEAGPIERAAHFIPQVATDKTADPARFRDGLWLIAFGLVKKMCISDLIAPFVSTVFSNHAAQNGSTLLVASILFAVQIYCDFSGYSDIAIGCARMLGFDLMINFRQPYFSTSVSEFWRRWHISLSSWFRDYVYFALGGSRVDKLHALRNMMIVFILSGVWHGAAWTFIIWGAIHGAVVCAEHLLTQRRAGLRTRSLGSASTEASPTLRSVPVKAGIARAAAGMLWTNLVVLIAWIFFRADSLRDALQIIGQLPTLGPIGYGTFKIAGLGYFELLLLAAHLAALLGIDWLAAYRPDVLPRLRGNAALGLSAAVLLFFDIVLFGVFETHDFIYFQF